MCSLTQVESDSARRKRKRLELEAQHTAKLRDLLAQSLIGEGAAVCGFQTAWQFLPWGNKNWQIKKEAWIFVTN